MSENLIKISVRDLYELVWKEPILTIARRFKIPDTDLRKLCNRRGIPIPKADYWTNPYVRNRTAKEKLRVWNDSDLEILEIEPSGMEVNGKFVTMSAPELRAILIANELGRTPQVPKQLRLPDSIIEFNQDCRLGKLTEKQKMKNKTQWLSINVDQQYLDRALRIFQALLDDLGEREHKLIPDCEETTFSVYDYEVPLCIKQKGKVLQKATDRFSRTIQYDGSLQLRVGPAYDARFFNDGASDYKLEDQFPTILGYIETFALERTKEREEIQARIKQKKDEENLLKQEQQKITDDFEKFKTLLFQANRYESATAIRKYVEAVRLKAEQNGNLSSEISSWTKWALEKADWYDPTINKDFFTIELSQIESLEKSGFDAHTSYINREMQKSFFEKKWYNRL